MTSTERRQRRSRRRPDAPLVRPTCYTSRGALLAGAVEQLCALLRADRGDRSLVFAALLGRPQR